MDAVLLATRAEVDYQGTAIVMKRAAEFRRVCGLDRIIAGETGIAELRRADVAIGIGDRAAIEFFNGPHTINGVGTFEFLEKHLNWPKPR